MLIQHLAYTQYYEGAKTMTYCASKKLHPHDAFIMVKLGYLEETSRGKVVENMISMLEIGIETFSQMKQMY